jgi:addiction module RelE/StbE family toxin
MWVVVITKSVEKILKKTPIEIRDAFDAWRNLVQMDGPKGLLKINGYRDHGLKGEWLGARSSSLNYQWRIIYFVDHHDIKIFVLEVTPHEYRRKL